MLYSTTQVPIHPNTSPLPPRLHREALKQSATDPLSGKIDISILTTGLSSAARKRRVELAQALRKLIQAKGRVHTLNFQKVFQEMKENSDLVSGRAGWEVHQLLDGVICGAGL